MAALLAPALAAAQHRASVQYDPAAAETRYIHNYRVAVNDVAGHVVRIYELRRSFRHGPPVFSHVRALQMLEQGYTDTVDENGDEHARITYFLEDGNTIHGEYRGAVQSFRWPDGTRHFDHAGTIALTGGSGRFSRIRGSINVRFVLDPGAESSQGKSEGEYWFEEQASDQGHSPGLHATRH